MGEARAIRSLWGVEVWKKAVVGSLKLFQLLHTSEITGKDNHVIWLVLVLAFLHVLRHASGMQALLCASIFGDHKLI